MTTGFSSLLPEGALAQDPALLWSAYVSADPLLSGIYITLALSAAVWILSVATGNYSWVDKLWSLTPVAFAWHFALHDYWTTHVLPGSRLLTMAVLCTFWGVRLTFNFARKGGYAWHGEDYRWPYLRARMHWTLFQVFNVVFISLYQNVLIFLFTLPAYAAWVAEAQGNGALRSIDFLAAFLFFSFLILETVADEHQVPFFLLPSSKKNIFIWRCSLRSSPKNIVSSARRRLSRAISSGASSRRAFSSIHAT